MLTVYWMRLATSFQIMRWNLLLGPNQLPSRAANMRVCSGAQHRWVNDFEYPYVSQRGQWC